MYDGTRGRRGTMRVRRAGKAKGDTDKRSSSCVCVCVCVCLFPSLSSPLPISVYLSLSLFFYQLSSLSLSVSLSIAPGPSLSLSLSPLYTHTHTHTHTPPSLLQAQLLWTPLWLLQISTLPPAPAHTRDSGYRQTQCHPVTCLCSPSLHLHPRSGSTRVNAWLPQP